MEKAYFLFSLLLTSSLYASYKESEYDQDTVQEKLYNPFSLQALCLSTLAKNINSSSPQLNLLAQSPELQEQLRLPTQADRKAADSNHVEIAELLIKHGADEINKAGNQAIASGHIDIVKLFMEYGFQIKSEHLIIAASGYCSTDKALPMLEFLLSYDLDINYENYRNEGALYAATYDLQRKDSYPVAKFLLDRNALPNGISGLSYDALSNSISKQDTQTALLLLDRGAKNRLAGYADYYSRSPLALALKYNNIQLIERLLASGFNGEKLNDHRHEELVLNALRENKIDLACVFLKHKKIVSYKSPEEILKENIDKNSLRLTACICQHLDQNAINNLRLRLPHYIYTDKKYNALALFITDMHESNFLFAVAQYKSRLARNRQKVTKMLQASGQITDPNVINSIVWLTLPNELSDF
ncbi:hypothetical protein H0X48_03205 [Candidatus Dependentiae bacterium]|nr:hypothetical protein [Candidatus Dependentiae bacterium]